VERIQRLIERKGRTGGRKELVKREDNFPNSQAEKALGRGEKAYGEKERGTEETWTLPSQQKKVEVTTKEDSRQT